MSMRMIHLTSNPLPLAVQPGVLRRPALIAWHVVPLQAIMFQAFNAVLNTVGVSLTRPAKNDEWSVSDGRRLSRFQDGMVSGHLSLNTAFWELNSK